MKYAVVTGGTGFIGEHLVNELVSHDYFVFVLTRDNDKETTVKRNVSYILYDSEEYNDLKKCEVTIDLFYHLAWNGVSANYKNDSDIQISNILFSLKMLEFAKEIGCKKFIAAGTVAEYVFCQNIMDFNLRQSPNDMYGAAKTATHYLLEVKARLLEQPFIWAVLPSTFGEGRRDDNIITYTITSLLNNEVPKYGKLEQMWDFLYISELTRALRFIGEKGICNKTYGIGSGVYRPLYSYIEEIRDIINPKMPLGIGEIPQYSRQTFSSCVGIYDIAKDTGWYPQISFHEGIVKTIEYYRGKM